MDSLPHDPVGDDCETPWEIPTNANERSVRELTSSVRNRIAAGEMDAPLIEDLRLFILVRLHQEMPCHEVATEIASWGLDFAYALELATSTATAGQIGEIEVSTELLVNGQSTGLHTNPTYHRRVRAADRAARRTREARRMAAAERGGEGCDLGFDLNGHLGSIPAVGPGKTRGRTAMAVLIAVAIAGTAVFLALLNT